MVELVYYYVIEKVWRKFFEVLVPAQRLNGAEIEICSFIFPRACIKANATFLSEALEDSCCCWIISSYEPRKELFQRIVSRKLPGGFCPHLLQPQLFLCPLLPPGHASSNIGLPLERREAEASQGGRPAVQLATLSAFSNQGHILSRPLL